MINPLALLKNPKFLLAYIVIGLVVAATQYSTLVKSTADMVACVLFWPVVVLGMLFTLVLNPAL